jgi:uncharacterized protein
MNRRQLLMLPGAAYLARKGWAAGDAVPQESGASQGDGVLPDKLLLKDYRPKSIYKIPVTEVKKSKFPCWDLHHHARLKTQEDVEKQLRLMDAVNMEKTVAFTGVTGAEFDTAYKLYSKYPDRFDVYCHLNMKGCGDPGFTTEATVKELERCHSVGAKGLGEIHDKGVGIGGSPETPAGPGPNGQMRPARPRTLGLHPDDPRMDALWEKCAELGMPVNLHMSDPYWSYLPQDKHNDGLMNGFSWRLDDKPGLMGHNELIQSFERTVKKHPKTVFIASHLLNLDYDLNRLGQIFQANPNVYADYSARFCETATIPRFVNQFLRKWAHRIVYGTDMPVTQAMFSTTFRILESNDEHFYEQDQYFNYNYHWPMHGFGLPDDILRKVYRDSAIAAVKQAKSSARSS